MADDSGATLADVMPEETAVTDRPHTDCIFECHAVGLRALHVRRRARAQHNIRAVQHELARHREPNAIRAARDDGPAAS